MKTPSHPAPANAGPHPAADKTLSLRVAGRVTSCFRVMPDEGPPSAPSPPRAPRTPNYKPPHRPSAALAIALALVASAPAQAQDADSLRAGLTTFLSTITLGTLAAPPAATRISRNGNDFHAQFPLANFSAPPNAAAEITARPESGGTWALTSVTLPNEGAIGPSIDQSISYTLAQQTIAGHLDPSMATASRLSAELGGIALHSVAGGRDTQQTIGRLALDANLTGAPDGRVNLLGRDSASNWRAWASDPASETSVSQLNGHFAMNGLDQAQAAKLVAAARALSAMPPPRAEHEGLRGLLEAADGLLTHVEITETADGIMFDLGHGNAGSLGRTQVHVNGGAEGHRVNAQIDLAADEAAWASASPDVAAFMPHHVTARSVVAGLPAGPLVALLRLATTPGADPVALSHQAATLLNTAGARAAIESFNFDAGPVHVRGSATVVPRPNGEAGLDIHISASGVDSLMAQAQGNPALRGITPFLFIAQGLGRPRGDGIGWDIAMGGGPLTINGTAFGQPLGKTR